MLGLYLHVPFCVSKCPYCDFYSVSYNDALADTYTAALERAILRAGQRLHRTADTVYFGGGTPALLGGERLSRLLRAARTAFAVPDTAEITLEANPADRLDDVFAAFVAAGGNRLSLGMQAVNNTHLRALGRRHSVADITTAAAAARRAGLHNISLDMMLGTPDQTPADVREAAARCADLGASHVSAYLLKIEEHTPFGEHPPVLPNEDDTVALYHTAADALASHGFMQYEISNFARTGCESRHNLKYWNAEEYLGLGPAAHSFIGGNRYAFSRSLTAFIDGEPPTRDTDTAIPNNSPEEYAMLRLRLVDGITEQDFAARFGIPIPTVWRERAAALPSHLVTVTDDRIALTREGFLLSTPLTERILF